MSDRGNRNQKRVQEVACLLKAVTAGDSPNLLYEAFRVCAPVAGGLIGAMDAAAGSMISHVVGLSSDVLEGWAATPVSDLRRMMAPLVSAAPGELISDRSAITGKFRKELELLEVLGSAGLGESAGYKIASRTFASGKQEHRFLTIALEGKAAFTPSQREIFRRIHPMIEAALARMALPILPGQPVFAHFLEERRIGCLCLSSSRAILELNERARELAPRYARAARVEPGHRGWLDRFAERVSIEAQRGRRWHLLRDDHRASVEISSLWLAKETYLLAQDVILVMIEETEIQETEPAPSPVRPSYEGLTRRQSEVAHLLVNTGMRAKQIAAYLDIAERTVGKHVEAIYERLGVNSRAELIERMSCLS
jgi:DNA-binding CsgD family transcriptional regulator